MLRMTRIGEIGEASPYFPYFPVFSRCPFCTILPKLFCRRRIAVAADPEVFDVEFHFGFAGEV